MKIKISGNTAHLEGNWTASGMTFRNIDLMSSSLEQLGGRADKMLRIDCEKLTRVDPSGIHFLNIWLQCIRLRGLEPELTNLSAGLQEALQGSGSRECSAALPADPAGERSTPSNRRTRRYPDESRRNQGHSRRESALLQQQQCGQLRPVRVYVARGLCLSPCRNLTISRVLPRCPEVRAA
jgi:ABC-type transporter Mla MlaB component